MLNEADPAECVGFFADKALPVAGEGAPLVSEFALMEYAAALGVTTESGFAQVGRILELRYRLPRLWARVSGREVVVVAGRPGRRTDHVPARGGCRVCGPAPGAGGALVFVGAAGPPVEEAMVRFDPAAAEAKRREAAEKRHVDVQVDQVSFDGTVQIDAEVDLADALDLEDALRAGRQAAGRPRVAPSPWTSAAPSPSATWPAASSPSGSKTPSPAGSGPGRPHLRATAPVGRCGNTRSPISVEQIREWCGNADAKVTVKPVVDLAEHIHVEAYEAPDRLKDQNALVDMHCVFPHCTKPASVATPTTSSPTPTAAPTSSANTAPLCRRHHRAKTHSAWDYSVLDRGTYLWTTPNGLKLIRDHRGTSHSRANPDHPRPTPRPSTMAGAVGCSGPPRERRRSGGRRLPGLWSIDAYLG